MEYTGNYYLPIALFLRNNGLFVSVVNPILVKDYSTKSLTVSRSISKRDSSSLRKTLFQIMQVILQREPLNNSVFQFMDKKPSEGKHFYVYMTAATNKFLRIYYARVTEYLNSLKQSA